MKKVHFFVICFVLLSVHSFADSKQAIFDFFKSDHSEFLDYHWLKPVEIFDQWNNASRFMSSDLQLTYHRKPVPQPIFEGINDYLGDEPISFSHKLNFRQIYYQSYKKEFDYPIFQEFEVREAADGDLRVIHKVHRFDIGTFNKTGKFDVLKYNQNGQINIDFWKSVHFDPWEGHLFFKRFIENEAERKTVHDYTSDATSFLFRFKDDDEKQIRLGSIELIKLAGFKQAVAVFKYNERLRPMAQDMSVRQEWTKSLISFDVGFRYDPRLFWVDSRGVAHLDLTRDEFLNP